MSRRTANKKLTKPYWPSRKRSPKRLTVLVELKKSEGARQKIFGVLPQFQIRSGATARSTQLHCVSEKRDPYKSLVRLDRQQTYKRQSVCNGMEVRP